ncbi:AfsR/SARP family transcriptional regulator [Kitasatospora sp. NPDC001175]|uniref:AfsR/SARP family transcriptional regulator n=1 Tax=Kitasatospora sp. NPDC001175 TaxID=3157103 RepID=UPI003D01E789
MEFRILGTLEAFATGCQMTPVRPRQRAVLAYLLLHANRRVSTKQLIDALWANEPPRTARAQVHTAISALRAALLPVAGRLSSEMSGYRLQTALEEVDVSIFQARLSAAQRLVTGRQPELAAPLLREALALWRGDALAGVDAPFAVAARNCLEEQRFVAHELLADLDLAAGRHVELIPRLTALLNDYPAREAVAQRLAVALYRGGRQADALAVLRRLRSTLVSEYGLEPGPPLADLEAALLRQDPVLDPPPQQPAASGPAAAAPTSARLESQHAAGDSDFTHPRPAQCPDRIAGFIGRAGELATLDRLLDGHAQTARLAVVTGPAGVGKTALVLEWANRQGGSFPDGQLYADLHGFDTQDTECPARILQHFLTALGIPDHRIPLDLTHRQALFRSSVAGRKILVVLDNASDFEQVRPLLPGSATGLTLVTSRDRLDGLIAETGAMPLPLPMFTPDESIEALNQITGPERLAAAPESACELAQLCGGLPLALRISAVRLAVEPATSVAELVAELAQTEDRLVGLSLPGNQHSVAGALEQTCRRLTAEQARLFRLLGSHPGPWISLAAAEALAGDGRALRGSASEQVRQSLRILESLHLVEQVKRDQYTMHPLVRLYAGRP